MAGRLAAGWDEAVEQALAEVDPDDLGDQVNAYLAESILAEEAAAKTVADQWPVSMAVA